MREARAQQKSSGVRDVLVREVFDTLRAALRYGAFAFLAYCGWRSIAELAARATGADLKLAVSTAIEVGKQEWTPWLATILLAVWALSERLFRLRKVDSMSARIAELEHRLEAAAALQSVGLERRNAGG